MRRYFELKEPIWPETPEFTATATAIMTDAINVMLGALWTAHDHLRAEMAALVGPGDLGNDAERSVTALLARHVRRALNGYDWFYCEHEYPEHETRVDPPARPPAYDLAFVLFDNPRIAWPVEAKVVATDRTVAAYVREIHEQYMTCRYAPFSSGGAMLAYVERGSPDVFQSNVEAALGVSLDRHAALSGRAHRVSQHVRTVPAGKSYPAGFTCHHLAMTLP